jgi:hypothetical protein
MERNSKGCMLCGPKEQWLPRQSRVMGWCSSYKRARCAAYDAGANMAAHMQELPSGQSLLTSLQHMQQMRAYHGITTSPASFTRLPPGRSGAVLVTRTMHSSAGRSV